MQNVSTPLFILCTAPQSPPSFSQMSRLSSIVKLMNGKQGQQNCEETCEFC